MLMDKKLKMTTIFAFLVSCLMVNNALFLLSYKEFGMYSYATIIALGGTIFFFIGINMAFSRMIDKIEQYKKELKDWER